MKKRFTWQFTILALITALTLSACSTGGQSAKYPDKAVTVVAPSGAGGGWDKTARSVTKILTETKLVASPLTVENKPGGGGVVFLGEYVSKDANDMHKLFVNSPPILINNWKSEGKSPYGFRDVQPLAQLTTDYGALVVSADSKYNDINEVIADIKADPTKVTVAGGSAPGSMDHLIAVLPAYKAGVDPKTVKYVSYDGGGEAMTALLGKNADVIATDASSVSEFLEAGKIKVLAVTSNERLGGILKDVPTLKEKGIDADFTIWRGVFGPKKLSPDQVKYWDDAFKALNDKEEWKKELEANGWVSEYKNSADFTKFLEEQEVTIKQLLTALGMANA
ncbi:Bug family tripartite tricarboxylate transporter substrate binding protein [Paenibacillus arenosi]|uniref:Tripartite tricarboxylate transporter substrate binding protein n=1 Tax=Paenibacillus arenosi TaxID=2774142 RepID=A0ABR9B3Z6_9BACL|nr:tripartite tricarboxylate transporter substrate binding protein [Paenibacillus arenosi]MBD8500152.1 tripartite tricarboxylate transporter substrate binding protein [Paenibacillus arenosi]